MLATNWLQIRQPEKNFAKQKNSEKRKKYEKSSTKNVQMNGKTQNSACTWKRARFNATNTIWGLSAKFLSWPKKFQIRAFQGVTFRILNARNLFLAARSLEICAFDVIWELSAKFLSSPKTVSNLSISGCQVSHSK
jgi:hypothetical protein